MDGEAQAEVAEELGAAVVEAQAQAFEAGVDAGQTAAAVERADYPTRDEVRAMIADAMAPVAVVAAEAAEQAEEAVAVAGVAAEVAVAAAVEASEPDPEPVPDGAPAAPEPRPEPAPERKRKPSYGAGWLSGNRG